MPLWITRRPRTVIRSEKARYLWIAGLSCSLILHSTCVLINRMDEDDTPISDPIGPITDAYLHRDVHPDAVPGTKAAHINNPLRHDSVADADSSSPDDLWMYH